MTIIGETQQSFGRPSEFEARPYAQRYPSVERPPVVADVTIPSNATEKQRAEAIRIGLLAEQARELAQQSTSVANADIMSPKDPLHTMADHLDGDNEY